MTIWTTLAQAEELAAALRDGSVAQGGPVIVDCRFSLADPEAGERDYRQAHIPGAVYAHLDRDLSDHRKRGQGQGRHPWPDASDFAARLGAWGIGPRTQVVAYDDLDGSHAARFWFLLRALGHERVAVLDGGIARWRALDLPLDEEVPSPRPVRYEASFDDARLLDAGQVQARLDAGDVLLDARGAPRFRGEVEPIDRVAGHVPGARNRPFPDNLSGGRFKPAAQLAEEFREVLAGREPARTIAMCGSGVTACHLILAMEHAGMPGAKLFTGSWSGWIEDPSRPISRA
ncbi:sulfurtransferase [Luteimonas sp. 8-5]|jgi:thiosulfate/3-mercaptopyruvate sulfurtransferase|uniref:sulfurtransferase n=1 Tax=Luteimonas sp. 8-5 TaxID=3039387 RepID=UPI0024370164|nr:sulfurtransferase [Luteimonas sp. 8-5]MDG6347225.1 sulfurtransferase [Luteimonas sp. 8-5]